MNVNSSCRSPVSLMILILTTMIVSTMVLFMNVTSAVNEHLMYMNKDTLEFNTNKKD